MIFENETPEYFFSGQVNYDSDFQTMLMNPELHISKLELHSRIDDIVNYFKMQQQSK